jgi:hypothetical protein
MSASLGRRGDVPRTAVAVYMTASLQAAGQLARGRKQAKCALTLRQHADTVAAVKAARLKLAGRLPG